MITWQLLHEGKCPAQQNMTKDLELFEAVKTGTIKGAFRMYNWERPAVTIGYHQKKFDFYDRDAELPLIRRPTGGGAVLHYDDITFSISSEADGVFPRNISDCSRTIAVAFNQAFQCCGIRADLNSGDHVFSPICFDRPAPSELVIDAGKIMGLALARKGGFILMQGVIPLRVDRDLCSQVFGAAQKNLQKGLLDYYPDFSGSFFLDCLRDVFASELGVLFHEGYEPDDKHGRTQEREIKTRGEKLGKDHMPKQ